jgi:Flp pilus assembly protein TadG
MNRLAKRFLKDRGGNFGMMTALLAFPLIIAGGSVIDLSTASLTRTNIQSISDSAALAGARIYDGTNATAAKAAAEKFLKGYAADLPKGATYNISMSGQTVQVSVGGSSPNTFMGMVGVSTTPVGVAASAIAPMKPKSVTFTPTKAQGWWYKKVSIMVVRPNSTAEEVIGTVVYQPETQTNGGQGPMTVSSGSAFDLGKYSKLILKMEVKGDGCPIEYRASVSNSKITCTKAAKKDKDYDSLMRFSNTLRTDDPNTSHYLFVDGVQMPKGSASPLERILGCDETTNHAWEDGGGFDRQDFFYTAKAICAPNGEYVRLTQ